MSLRLRDSLAFTLVAVELCSSGSVALSDMTVLWRRLAAKLSSSTCNDASGGLRTLDLEIMRLTRYPLRH
ncbi:hypothetical protein M514_00807 [Trichuris suis]|uniref:Secreted protein n=1 Tax=Trichuris suis TaxID=68888 RepID=A0A085MMY5_9BILA|nr:hypothetical protein M513_00807 [Trichuris suis]KFD66038.1 hypothetical protein M514_00807 [Trichuris suis]